MANETRRFTSSKDEDVKLVAMYEQLKEGKTEPSRRLQQQLVFQLLDTKVAKLDRATDRLRLIRNVLRIATLAGSGLATMALGLKGQWLSAELAQDIALVLTALVTFLGSLAALWEVDNYWLRNKIMLNKLKQLRYRFAFVLTEAGGGRPEDVKAIFDETIGALGDEYWEKMLNRVAPPPVSRDKSAEGYGSAPGSR